MLSSWTAGISTAAGAREACSLTECGHLLGHAAVLYIYAIVPLICNELVTLIKQSASSL